MFHFTLFAPVKFNIKKRSLFTVDFCIIIMFHNTFAKIST